MTRSSFAVVVFGAVAGLALAPAFLEGCTQTGVGDPCVPAKEYDTTFNGFDPGEVNVESKSFQCQTRLCLANHFRGRVSCPYGQTIDGKAPALNAGSPYTDKNGTAIGPCSTPAGNATKGVPVVGVAGSSAGATVDPQCLDRQAKDAVYCSCRCANVNGKTDDGAVYCACPDGFSCQQLVTQVSTADTGLTGAYCIKNKTQYDAATSCQTTASNLCDASKQNCGSSERAVTHPPPRRLARGVLGSRAEDAAADFLVARGFEVLGRNVRVGPSELDIVARRGDLVTIVEVRTRGEGSFVGALGSVDAKKRASVVRGGERLWREKLVQIEGIARLRFDVAAVTFGEGGTTVEHIEAAFTA